MSGKTLTYQQLYARALAKLSSFEAAQLFAHCTGSSPYDLPFIGQLPAPPAEVASLLRLCTQRGQGIPLQYLLGEWEFYGLPFQVGPGVLIPRSDTETLVEVALGLLRSGLPAHAEVLELCAGSGCIAIALAHSSPDCRVTAVELSNEAFGFLKKNIALNKSPVKAIQGDLHVYRHPNPVDLLVSNPPYIPQKDLPTLQKEVQFEPALALDGGSDGLDFYRAIARLYCSQLRNGGWLCVEIGIGQEADVSQILESCGYCEIRITEDLGGVPRVIAAQKSSSFSY